MHSVFFIVSGSHNVGAEIFNKFDLIDNTTGSAFGVT